MSRKSPLIIIGLLFFIFGFITWLNSALVPFLKIACELNNFGSYFVTFVFYIAYFIFAIPSAKIIDRIGYRRSISLGLGVMALGGLFFIPAAMTRFYLFFLTGLFLMGAGLALLQTAANPYAAVLGSPQTAARRIGIMGMCNKFAGILAPLFLGALVLKEASVVKDRIENTALSVLERNGMLDALAGKCLLPYIGIVLALILLAFLVSRSDLPEMAGKTDEVLENNEDPGLKLFSRPRLWGGVLALFFYVGAEVISVDSLINYAQFYGISAYSAKIFPSLSMLAFLIGYLIGVVGIPRWFSQRSALILSAMGSLVVVAATLLASGMASVYFLVWLGLTNAMIWPSVWGLAIEGLGRHTSTGSSLLIMAIVGGALLPLLFGYAVDTAGFRRAYLLLFPCYLIILLYGLLCGRPVSCRNK